MKKNSIVLGSLMGLAVTVTAVSAAVAGFNDIPSDHWAAKSVENLKNAGVIQGYTDGTFQGNKEISRYEVSVIVDKNNEDWKKKMDAMTVKLTALEEKVADLEEMMDEDTETSVEMKEQFGEVKKVYELNGKFYMDFDDMEWLVWTNQNTKDKEKIIADIEKNDPGACDLENVCMPKNGYYTLNESDQTEAIILDDIEINILDDNLTGYETITAEEFNTYFNDPQHKEMYGSPFFWLEMDGDTPKVLNQKYTP